ncbi:MAG: LacI family DNA-binding transcriptional regulator [Candidatus Humimicrobiaceae bacterium]
MVNKKELSIKEIAKLAGVSKATVSNALSGKRHVKPSTKEKILNLVKKYNYRPSVIARGLCQKKTSMVGVIIADIYNPYYSEVIKGIEAEIKKNGYILIVGSTNYKIENEIKEFERLNSLCIDGFIFISSQNSQEKIEEINTRNVPIVFIDREIKNYSSVLINNKKAMEKAVAFLRERGHKKIGYVGCKGYAYNMNHRYKGYLSGLKKNNLNCDRNLIFLSEKMATNEFNIGYKLIDSYIKKNEKIEFTALLSQADIIAFGIIRALQDNGFNVPEDVSVVGFDNIHSSRFSNPRLTTVNQPKRKMGKIGARILLKELSNGKKVKDLVYLDTVVVERESTIMVN